MPQDYYKEHLVLDYLKSYFGRIESGECVPIGHILNVFQIAEEEIGLVMKSRD